MVLSALLILNNEALRTLSKVILQHQNIAQATTLFDVCFI